jgi:hypothetical protein
MRFRMELIVIMAGLTIAPPSFAQGQPRSPQSLEGSSAGCAQAGKAEAATPPARDSGDGTAPGNAGSTGWSGGTGGSHIGTNPSGAVRQSRTWQPPTARGLDPLAAPARPAAAC